MVSTDSPQSLGQAREHARERLRAGDYPAALTAFTHLLELDPADLDSRLGVADLLARLGLRDEAAGLYRALAERAIASGRPLLALVAASALGPPSEDLLRALATVYAAGSARLAPFATRPLPADAGRPIPPLPPAAPVDAALERCLARAADWSAVAAPQGGLPPIPLLSALGPTELLAVLRGVRVRRARHAELLVRQGEPGHALFLVALGEVAVFTTDPAGAHHELARLTLGSLFGEMALLTDQPRTASVAAIGEADVIEIDRQVLADVTEQLPAVAQVLDRFARERLVKNLLATSPLFRPFGKTQQAELLTRFDGVEYPEDAIVLAEGGAGTGLFVVLSGEVEVTTSAATGEVTLARLRSGEVFGEMSLLANRPTSATVRATRQSTLLFLHRDYFQRLVGAVPELRGYFEQLARTRAQERLAKLAAPPRPPAAPVPPSAHGDDIEIDILI